MKYDRNTIIAITVCVLLLLLWTPLMRRVGWLPSSTDAPPQRELPEDVSPDITQERIRDPAPDHEPVKRLPATPLEREAEQLLLTDGDAESLRLMVPATMTVELGADGSGVSRVRLHQYLTDDREQQVEIGKAEFPLCTAILEFAGWEVQDIVVQDHTETRLLVVRRLTNGLEVSEEWELLPNNEYQMAYRLSVRNNGSEAVDIRDLAVSAGAIHTTTSDRARMRSGAGGEGAIDLFLEDSGRPQAFMAKKLSKMGQAEVAALETAEVGWIALHSKYFLFYLAARTTPFAGCRIGIENIEERYDEAPWLYGYAFLPPQQLLPGAVQTWSFDAYMGPKEYEKLERIGGGLQSIMRLDLFLLWHPRWMGVIARLILRSLIALNDFFKHAWGYGFAIVIITFVVKMLFWPLTHRSTVSMRKMQKIQPLVKEIREKYKDQPEKMNRKMMELYRAHKVNPVGGCLPIVFQIPVFFALFNTLRSAIELRHAEFLWVADLSLPDTIFEIPFPGLEFVLPIRPLALIMGLSMFGQQKLMPTSPDPQQAKMMSFMSLFMVVLFYGMPAGLTLYWTVNQLLTIGQNLVSRSLHKDEELQPETPVKPEPGGTPQSQKKVKRRKSEPSGTSIKPDKQGKSQ